MLPHCQLFAFFVRLLFPTSRLLLFILSMFLHLLRLMVVYFSSVLFMQAVIISLVVIYEILCTLCMWVVPGLGDFNSVMGAHETTGVFKCQSCEEFCAGATICNLTDLDSQKPFYTWQGFRRGKIVMSRLDRAFCNTEFLEQWQQVSSICLPRTHLDHHPLLLSSSKTLSTGP
ncbi:LOW QUALITY PROTEIN: Endonuclease/exonuclease/phosphatase [Trema orientale]|uniref:Endonuclease/exonuclease/phosphatase n=1 Tax=Trema orientale TaxID=63057 RepID=A0A2P5CQG6_TREOI|nr:LOW QUALITY PROTEIN: Endonuclease/exonuclease/phosphatase [Trema orientale]